jgi:hypothetical protein
LGLCDEDEDGVLFILNKGLLDSSRGVVPMIMLSFLLLLLFEVIGVFIRDDDNDFPPVEGVDVPLVLREAGVRTSVYGDDALRLSLAFANEYFV